MFESWPKIDFIVYRLIDAALIRIFSMTPSYFKIEIYAKCVINGIKSMQIFIFFVRLMHEFCNSSILESDIFLIN